MCGLLEKYLVDRNVAGLQAVLKKHGITPSDKRSPTPNKRSPTPGKQSV
jgi:hypothetical protein